MPLTQLLNREWLDHNAGRRYPLAIMATGKDVTGDFELPNDFLVSMYLSVPVSLNVDPASFTLYSVHVFATGFRVTFGYWTGTEVLQIAAGSVLRATHRQYQSYTLRGLGDFADARGHMTIGKFDNIDLQPAGAWVYDIDGGRLEVDVIRPQIRGVQQIRVQNGSDISDPLVGDIVLKAGRNCRITPVVVFGDDTLVVFDAIEGEGLNEDCVCEGNIDIAPPIRTINRIPPAADGNFTLLGTDCLQIDAIENGLRLKDICAKPCCGCKELEVVTTALEQFGRQATTLENFQVGLEARVSQMDQVVLGAKLGDQGCFVVDPAFEG